MWVKSLSADFYPTKESLGNDVVALLRAELIALRDAGCAFVQFDEPVLTEWPLPGRTPRIPSCVRPCQRKAVPRRN